MRRFLVLAGLTAAISFALTSTQGRVAAGTALRLDTAGLVDRSELVLEGRVHSARTVRAENGMIQTEYVIGVERTLLGDDVAVRTIALPGGVLPDGRGLIVAGMPHLAPNEDVLLFLSAPTSWGMRTPVGLAQGKLRVVTTLDGERHLTRSLAGLTWPGGEHAPTQVEGIDYAQTIAEIHAAVAARGGERR